MNRPLHPSNSRSISTQTDSSTSQPSEPILLIPPIRPLEIEVLTAFETNESPGWSFEVGGIYEILHDALFKELVQLVSPVDNNRAYSLQPRSLSFPSATYCDAVFAFHFYKAPSVEYINDPPAVLLNIISNTLYNTQGIYEPTLFYFTQWQFSGELYRHTFVRTATVQKSYCHWIVYIELARNDKKLTSLIGSYPYITYPPER